MVTFDERGRGEPLVLVHGSWGERSVWERVVPRLATRFRVIAYDRRGHGGAPGSGTLDDDARDLAELIRDVAGGRARVAANSLGGCVVLRLLRSEPELVEAAALHEPPLLDLLAGGPELRPMVEETRRTFAVVLELLRRGQPEEGARRFVDFIDGLGAWASLPEAERTMAVRNAGTFLEEMEEPGVLDTNLDALRRVDVPVLLTGGEASPPFFARVLDRLEPALPRSRRVRLAGTGHVPHATHPDAYVRALVDFFAEAPAPRT